MQVARTTTHVSFLPFGITAETEERVVNFVSDDMIIISREGDSAGCRFKLVRVGKTIITAHMADVDLISGEDIPHTDYCKLHDAKYSMSPHHEAVETFVGKIPRGNSASCPPPTVGAKNAEAEKTKEHVCLQQDPNPCPICGTPCYEGDCPNCK